MVLKLRSIALALGLICLTHLAMATVVTVGGGASVTCPATPTATWTTPPAGVTFSNWSRGSGVTCGSAANGLSGSGFNTANAATSFAANKYYSVTLTADATHTFTLDALTWTSAVSSGTATFTVQYSNNGGTLTTFGSAVSASSTGGSFTGSVSVAANTSIVLYLVPSNTGAAGTTLRWINGSTITVTAGNTITVTQATGGTISPGTTTVASGGSQNFTATPATCYSFTNWVVDGSAAGSSNPYTGFTNVTAPHTITAVYTALGPNNITASAGANGTVTPTGATSVACGGSQTYTISPNACYSVTDVLVDGVSQGAITTYSFSNVTAPHTISATFGSSASYNIVASAGANGSISPSGTTAVPCGNTQTYTITPNACYDVLNVTVDGVSQGAITT